ncbi:MAG TPA: FecR family protein [Candidatus Dormibacteraeota bacterium]|nr:FecR family protein [Candidatus Dormibacteraeota bacterium]
MKTKSPYAGGLAMVLSTCMIIPSGIWAAPQGTPQSTGRAGEVSRIIPAVSIARGSKTITASTKSVVDWQDLLNTQANARARIALDDGSVLNVGSDTSMKVVKHDAGAQQTELELTYGKLRAQAQKVTKPDGKFEVRTPAGVAGVVGTDFYVAYATAIMSVVVFEGIVRVCNLAGVCVEVKAGQMTSVRSGDNSAPLTPVQAPLDVLVAAAQDTDVGGNVGAVTNAHHISKGTAIMLGILAVVPAVVVPIVSRGNTQAPPPCNPKTDPNRCGG